MSPHALRALQRCSALLVALRCARCPKPSDGVKWSFLMVLPRAGSTLPVPCETLRCRRARARDTTPRASGRAHAAPRALARLRVRHDSVEVAVRFTPRPCNTMPALHRSGLSSRESASCSRTRASKSRPCCCRLRRPSPACQTGARRRSSGPNPPDYDEDHDSAAGGWPAPQFVTRVFCCTYDAAPC